MNSLIVFGPGFGDPTLVIDKLAQRFEGDFDRVILTYPNRGTTHSIPEITENCWEAINGLRHWYKNVFFVGHSMGGLIGRSLMDLSYPKRLFDGYVSIATPHDGTSLASLLPQRLIERFSPSAADMRPASDYLNHINETIRYHFDPNYPAAYTPAMTIHAHVDGLVFPRKSTRIPGVQHVIIPWTNHLTVALSQRTYGEIYSFFKYEILNES